MARVWLQSEFGGGLHGRCFGAALIVSHVSGGIVRGLGFTDAVKYQESSFLK